MAQRSREQDIVALNTFIEAMDLVKEISSITLAKAVFSSTSIMLTMIRVSFLLVFCQSIAD